MFGPAMSFGRFFRGSVFERAFGDIVVRLTDVRKQTGNKPVIMGHLHHYFVKDNLIVLPKFPRYAVLRGSRLEIRNFLDEI